MRPALKALLSPAGNHFDEGSADCPILGRKPALHTLPAVCIRFPAPLLLLATALHGAPVPRLRNTLNATVALLLRGEIEDAISTVRPHLPRDPRAVDLLLHDGVPSLPDAALFSS